MVDIEIEHALKEWENGTKTHKVAFGEDIMKQRLDFLFYLVLIFIDIYSSYDHHLGNWKRMAFNTPT